MGAKGLGIFSEGSLLLDRYLQQCVSSMARSVKYTQVLGFFANFTTEKRKAVLR